MAEKILQTRIINKHADLATWKDSTLPLKTGEIALARVETTKPDGHGGSYTVPTYLMKVGDGEKTFSQLEWLAAPASDVYEWAKAATKPGYTATEIARGASTVAADLKAAEDEIATLKTAVGNGGSVATMIEEAIKALDKADSAVDNQFVTAVAQEDGTISVARRALTDADIANLNVAMSKVTGLTDALALKANAADVKQTTDAITTRLDSGDIKQAIDAAKTAGDNAQAYAEGIYKVNGDTKTGVLAEYMTSNDAVLAAVKKTAEDATTVGEVDNQIDAKITTFKTNVTDKIDERVATNATNIGEEVNRATKAEEALAARVKANEDAISTLNAATTFAGTGTYAEMLAKEVVAGSIFVVVDTTDEGKQYNNKEFVYDGSKWVELGDTTAELNEINGLKQRVLTIETDLGENGDTTKAIAAAQSAINTHIADKENPHEVTKAQVGLGNVENKSTATIKSEFTGSVAKDDEGFVTGSSVHTAIEAAKTTVNGYTDGLVKTINEAAAALKSTVDTHVVNEENPHKVTAEQVGLGKVENKTVAEIKTELTGAVADGNDKFVTGDAAYDAIEAAKTANKTYTDTEVGKVDQKADNNATDITTIKNNYARVSGDQLVYGQGENEMVIIFDCGGAN